MKELSFFPGTCARNRQIRFINRFYKRKLYPVKVTLVWNYRIMAKKVTFGVKPQEQQLANLDSWVETRSPQLDRESTPEIAELGREQGSPSMTHTQAVDSSEQTPAPKEKIERLTLDIPETLHRTIKGRAAIEGVAMVDMLRSLLEEKYGNL
jgi:hypothetical protein